MATCKVKRSYTQKVQNSLGSTQEALGSITVTLTSGSGNDVTSTTVVDTGYITSNTTSMVQQSAKNAIAVTITSSTTTTTTTTGSNGETGDHRRRMEDSSELASDLRRLGFDESTNLSV